MTLYLGTEENLADFLLWLSFLSSLVLGFFFCAQIKYGICGWEVAYMAVVESLVYIIAIGWEDKAPFTASLISGQKVPWLRYVEWLITCPVILIALSRVGQAEGGYSRNTMKLLTSDQGTIILGILSASTPDSVGQALFYLAGVAYGFCTFYTAATVYMEAWASVPDETRPLLKVMIYLFFSGWLCFPLLFILGPEGAGHLSTHGSTIGHTVADIAAKQLWSVCEWQMENMLHRINEDAEDDEDDEDNEMDDAKAQALENAGSGKAVILDNTSTVGPFFEMQLKKLGADPVCVETLDAALALLKDIQEGEKPYDIFMIGGNELDNPSVQDMLEDVEIPIVAFTHDVTVKSEGLRMADDVVPIPVFGMPYNLQPLTVVWCKHSQTKSIVDSKDVIIEQLFNQINTLQEKVDRAPPSGSNSPKRMSHGGSTHIQDQGAIPRTSQSGMMMDPMQQVGTQQMMMQQQSPMGMQGQMGMQQQSPMMGGMPQGQMGGQMSQPQGAFHFM